MSIQQGNIGSSKQTPMPWFIILAAGLWSLEAAGAEQIVRFDFETGDLQGWKVVEGSFRSPLGKRPRFNNPPHGPHNRQGKFCLSTLENEADMGQGSQVGVIERLVPYMTRCPFSLSRLVKVSATGQVVYKAEKQACRAFPEPQGNELARGPKRNFQVLSPLEFLAEFTQHIPPTGSHLIRYYGWYSNKARGMRRKRQQAAAEAAATSLGAGLPTPPIVGPQVSSEPPQARRLSAAGYQCWL